MTDKQKEILGFLNNNPHITRSQLSQIFQINESAVSKHLDNLKKKGIIKRIGGTRGYWELTQSTDIDE